LLTNLPPSSDVFVSILAVNNLGEESPFFVEEANVKTGTMQAQSSSAPPTVMTSSSAMTMASSSSQAPAMNEQSELRLLRAEAISATGVVLHFSHAVSIPSELAAQAITISTGSGKILGMRRFIIQGNTVTVHTATQERFTVYQVLVSSVITGTLSNGQTVMLASDQAPVLFMGHETGIAPMEAPSMPSTNKPEVTQLRLRAEPDSASTYAIDAVWQAPATSGITGYSIAQTTDGGQTFSTARMVGPATTAVKIAGVPTGQFGILIKVLYADGTASTGVSQVIALPALGTGGAQGDVTGKGSETLPDSGPALWVLVMIAGAVAGMWKVKTRQVRALAA
jgi:hypothetical protein